jgi:Ca2+-binding RTX toxin-like protein
MVYQILDSLTNRSSNMQTKFPIIGSITFMVLLLTLTATPMSKVWAGSDDDDLGDYERTIETSNESSDAFTAEPLHPEKNTITGNNDGDEIKGTRHAEIIIGSDDNDRIFGLNRDDVINGAAGADTIEGDKGDDTIQGAGGAEQMYGNDGDDVLSGGNEADYLSGGSGRDELYAGESDDTLRGGSGADYFDCGSGFDTVIDFDPSRGDTHSSDCEVIYEV